MITLSFNLYDSPIWVDFYSSLKAEAQKGNMPNTAQLEKGITQNKFLLLTFFLRLILLFFKGETIAVGSFSRYL